jgi:cytochrome c peroxidase
MEKRRATLRLLLAALGLAAGSAAWACTPALEGTRLESPRFALAYKAVNVEVGRHFHLEIESCAKSGDADPALKVDAHMPEHKHGMNYAPTVTKLAPGRWRAEGLLFHMPGKWEFVFELRSGDSSDLLRSSFLLSAFTEEEKKKILSHGPWPPKMRPDPGNRVSGKMPAVMFGRHLFFEPRLSGTGSVLCATCHVPFRGFQDGRPRAFGLEEVDRNTQTIVNVRFWRWFGWDGGSDSLWAQSIRPLLDEREMKATPAHVAGVVRKLFAKPYEAAFGRAPPDDDQEVLADVGKALAAFQETLVTGATPFDDFRDALEKDDPAQMEKYPEGAKRGLKIFVGKGNCGACHFGPFFSNGEFADTGVPFFAGAGKVDSGRHGGIRKLRDNAFNLLSRFNDDASGANATGTRHVDPQHRNFGEFRVPSLREVARTAPYMHNGSLPTLSAVVDFYSNLNEERLHADGEKILKPLKLTDQEAEDLVAFLQSLTMKPRRQKPQ